MIKFGADFSTGGEFEIGLSPLITIMDISDGSVVASGIAMTEIGDGAYKYNFDNDITKNYRAKMDGGVDTLDSRYMTAWSGMEKTEAEVSAILSNQEIRKVIITDAAPSKTVFETNLTEIAHGFWSRGAVKFTSGQNEGAIRKIQNYNGATKKLTLRTALPYTPLTNDTLDIIPLRCFRTNIADVTSISDGVWDELRMNHTISGTTGEALTDIKERTDNLPDFPSPAQEYDDDITFLKDIEGGKWEIVNNQMIFKRSDNATVVATFNLFDENGIATMQNVYKRERV